MSQNNFVNSVEQATQAVKRFSKTWEELEVKVSKQDAETREQYDIAWSKFWRRMNS